MHRRAHTKFQRPRMILITATFRTIFRIFDETSRKTQPATHSLGAVKKKSKKSHFCITLADIPEKQHNSNDKGVQLGDFWFGRGAEPGPGSAHGRDARRRGARVAVVAGAPPRLWRQGWNYGLAACRQGCEFGTLSKPGILVEEFFSTWFRRLTQQRHVFIRLSRKKSLSVILVDDFLLFGGFSGTEDARWLLKLIEKPHTNISWL